MTQTSRLVTALGLTSSVGIDVREDGYISAVVADSVGHGVADGDYVYWELSFMAAPQTGVNDTTSVVLSGLSMVSTTKAQSVNVWSCYGMQVPIAAGERLYLHQVVSGTTTFSTRATVMMETKGGGAIRPIQRLR